MQKNLDYYCAVHIMEHRNHGSLLSDSDPGPTERVKMATTPNFEDFQSFSKQQMEAFTSAAATWTKGMQELAAESTDYAKKAFSAGSAVYEKMLGARSIESAIQIQSEYAKQAYEGFVAQASKVSDLYAKVAGDVMKPVASAYTNLQPK